MVKATLSRCYEVSLKSLSHILSLDEWYREPTLTHRLHALNIYCRVRVMKFS